MHHDRSHRQPRVVITITTGFRLSINAISHRPSNFKDKWWSSRLKLLAPMCGVDGWMRRNFLLTWLNYNFFFVIVVLYCRRRFDPYFPHIPNNRSFDVTRGNNPSSRQRVPHCPQHYRPEFLHLILCHWFPVQHHNGTLRGAPHAGIRQTTVSRKLRRSSPVLERRIPLENVATCRYTWC
jgi:hypothetical protein